MSKFFYTRKHEEIPLTAKTLDAAIKRGEEILLADSRVDYPVFNSHGSSYAYIIDLDGNIVHTIKAEWSTSEPKIVHSD